jgi:hypothetical protein
MREIERTESIGSVSGHDKFRKIGIASVIAITYFNVSGGPFGSEEIVSSYVDSDSNVHRIHTHTHTGLAHSSV